MLNRFCPQGVLRLLPVALASAVSWAADPASLPFGDVGDAPTVLSATRLSQSLFETPAAVSVIDRQMIEQTGVREVPELLRLVPGMVVGYESGSEAFVSFHGTSADLARRMQVLVDGRSIYQPLLASVDWIGLPLELADIERIEVIRGPNSSSWGANSFMAVVNIVTRHPADVERARVSYRSGEDGISDYVARLAQRSGSVDWRLTVAGRSDDGFEFNGTPAKSSFGTRFTDSKDVSSTYGRAIWAPGDVTSVELQFGYARMTAEQHYRNAYFAAVPVAERDNDYVSLALDQEVNEHHHFRLQASHSVFRRDEPWLVSIPPAVFNATLGALYKRNRDCANGVFVPFSFDDAACTSAADDALVLQYLTELGLSPAITSGIIDPNLSSPANGALLMRNFTSAQFRSGLDAHERRTTVDLQDTWAPGPDFRAVFGGTYDEAQAESRVYLKGFVENTVWRAFAHAEWRFAPNWLLNVGGNKEFDEGGGTHFSPRYALNWQFSDSQVLRAVYSQAVRTPDILEERADFSYIAVAVDPADALFNGNYYQSGQGNGEAPSENITSAELGYYGRFDVIRLAMDLRIYRDRMDLSEHGLDITASDGFLINPPQRSWMNGVEWSADWRPLPSQRLHLSYAYVDMDGTTPDDDNTNFVPQHAGSAGWWQDYGNGLAVGNTYYFYNDLRTDRGFFYDRLDTRLAKTFRLGATQQVTLAGVVQHRLTEDPELREENRGDRRRGWVSLDWRY